METRIRLLLLSAVLLACSGCATMHWPWQRQPPAQPPASPVEVSAKADENAPPPTVIEPQVDRRTVSVPKISARNLEIGGYYGEISIQDFGAQPVAGARLDYHITDRKSV